MQANYLRSHWLLTAIAGACLIVNIGFVIRIVFTLAIWKPLVEQQLALFLEFTTLGPAVLILSVIEAAYVFLTRRPVDPMEAFWVTIFREISIVNSTIPIIFGAFAFAVYYSGYFWLR